MKFYECGCCGQYHKQGYEGDCRNDSERYSTEEVVDMIAQEEWLNYVEAEK